MFNIIEGDDPYCCDDIKLILNKCGISYTQRPASLNLNNWYSLYKILESQIPNMDKDIEIS